MKGSVDISTLIVAAAPIVLLLLLSAIIIAEENLTADLVAEMRLEENKFQTISAHSQLMDNETQKKIGLYKVQEKEGQGDDINSTVEKVLGSTADYYSFRYEKGGGAIKKRSDQLVDGVRFSTYVPSPHQEMVKARTAAEFSNSEE